MDTAQWPQEIVVKPIEEMIVTNKERIIKTRLPTKQQVINCPRCNSTNTKFCYYNNYSLTQPRYFCKTCRRYWTEGGSLRNIPVGGGSRKNKRSSASSSSSSTSSITTSNITRLPDSASQTQSHKINQTPQDLNLAFQSTSQHHHFNHITDFIQEAHHNIENNNNNISVNSTPTDTNTSHLSALELITGLTSRGFNSFMPMSVPDPNGVVYNNTSGFPLVQEFKPSLNFSLNGVGSGYSSSVPDQTNGRLLFPFEDLKEVDDDQQNNKEQGEPTGYWTGMLGGGSW